MKTEQTITKLKEIVDRKSLNYLTVAPYKVYEELIESDTADRKTAGAILCFLVSGMLDRAGEDYSFEKFSKEIQKTCCFNKRMADVLTTIFISLCSMQNREKWKKMNLQGMKRFREEKFSFKWKGFSVWHYSTGSVSCHYETDIMLIPTETIVVDSELAEFLRRNPFMTKEEISSHYSEVVVEYLNREFEEYCTCDDYYQPVVEDFPVDSHLEMWCKENGFELVGCSGVGYDDGYEPKIMRGCYY